MDGRPDVDFSGVDRTGVLSIFAVHSSCSRSIAGLCGFFTLIQSLLRPDWYRESRRFDTIPSSPILQAEAKIAAPSTDAQTTARTPGLQLHVMRAGTERDLDTVFASLVRRGDRAAAVGARTVPKGCGVSAC